MFEQNKTFCHCKYEIFIVLQLFILATTVYGFFC